MSANRLVSILMPAYNAAPYIAESIASALAQTHADVEVIVVNDGSRDETLKITQSIRDPRLKVINQENRGQSASENVAFRICQGDYVVYLDADDLISPNKLESQLQRLASDEPGCVAFHPWGRFFDDPCQAKCLQEPFWRDIPPLEFHAEMWVRHSMVQGACYLIPRSNVEAAPPWNEELSLANDFPYFPRVLMQAPRMLFCPEPTLYYRSGQPNALSAHKSSKAWTSAYQSVASGTAFLLSIEDSLRMRRAVCRQWEEFVYGSYPLVPALAANAWQRVRELGGPHFQPQMGPRMRLVAQVFGWKAAKRIQSWSTSLRRAGAK